MEVFAREVLNGNLLLDSADTGRGLQLEVEPRKTYRSRSDESFGCVNRLQEDSHSQPGGEVDKLIQERFFEATIRDIGELDLPSHLDERNWQHDAESFICLSLAEGALLELNEDLRQSKLELERSRQQIDISHRRKYEDVTNVTNTSLSTFHSEGSESAPTDCRKSISELKFAQDAENSTLQHAFILKMEEEDQGNKLLSQRDKVIARKISSNEQYEELIGFKGGVPAHDIESKDQTASWDSARSAACDQSLKWESELSLLEESESLCLPRGSPTSEELAKAVRRGSFTNYEQNAGADQGTELISLALQLKEALKDGETKSKLVEELNEDFKQVQDRALGLSAQLSALHTHVETELAKEVLSLSRRFQSLENNVSEKAKQYNRRLERAQSLLSFFIGQFKMLVTGEAVHIQNLEKAEAEVDLLGDDVDALLGVLEKVLTVLSRYHAVIQHYPELAKLASEVKDELEERVQ